MADFGAPAQANYTAPDGLATLGNFMSLKQKQQGLQAQQLAMQGQQSENQSLAAKASTDTRAADEQAKLAQIPWDSFENPDGSYDVDKARKMALKVAPTTGAAFAEHLNQTTKGAAETKKAFMSLSADQQAAVGNVAGAWASDPNATVEDLTNLTKQRIAQSPQSVQPALGKITNHIMQVMTTPNPDGTPKSLAQQKQVATMISRQALSASDQSGPGGLNTPQLASVNNGAQTLIGTTAPAVKGGAFAPQTAVTHQLTPGERLPQAAPTGAGMMNRDPRTGALTAPPAAPGTNPSQAQTKAASGMAENDTTRYSQISQEGTNAQTGAQLADQVSHLADQVRTGKLSKEWADKLAVLKQHDPNITDRQMLSKYAAQLKTMATAGATTDASRSQIDEGMPNPESMDPDAVKQAAQYVGGIFKMRGARQAHADQFTQKSGSPMGIQGADDAFMRAADPTIFAYKSLSPGAERQEFLKAHGLTTAEKLQDFKARMNQVDHYSGGK